MHLGSAEKVGLFDLLRIFEIGRKEAGAENLLGRIKHKEAVPRHAKRHSKDSRTFAASQEQVRPQGGSDMAAWSARARDDGGFGAGSGDIFGHAGRGAFKTGALGAGKDGAFAG